MTEGVAMSAHDLYEYQYERYFKDRDNMKGYDFQNAPTGSAPVPKVTFTQKLRWWTLDRWRRRKKIREERDRRIQDILAFKQQPKQ